jgi:hypothetical protein
MFFLRALLRGRFCFLISREMRTAISGFVALLAVVVAVILGLKMRVVESQVAATTISNRTVAATARKMSADREDERGVRPSSLVRREPTPTASSVIDAENYASAVLSRTPEGRKLLLPEVANRTRITYRSFLARFADAPAIRNGIVAALVEMEQQVQQVQDVGDTDFEPRRRALVEADGKIQTLLGDGGFRDFVEFRETLFLRAEFDDVDARLRYGNAPLTPPQVDRLTALLSQTPGSERILMESGNPLPPEFIERAAAVLNEVQMAALKEINENRRERAALCQTLRENGRKQ